MATLSGMRDLLFRRLNEPSDDTGHWTAAQLTSIINTAYGIVQAKIISAGNPEFAIRVDRTDIISGQTEYSWPLSMHFPLMVRILNSTTNKYEVIDRKNLFDVLKWTQDGDGGETVYAHYGRSLLLTPAPAATVANGLEVMSVPILTLGSDASVIQLRDTYSHLIVMEAELIARGETSDNADNLIKERDALYASFGILSNNGGDSQRLQPQVDKGY